MTEIVKGRIYGLYLRTARVIYDDEILRQAVEATAAIRFKEKYGFAPHHIPSWRYEPARTWYDEETGEYYDMPEEWICLVEGGLL